MYDIYSKMKVISNENNCAALKICIAANYSGNVLEHQIVGVNDDIKHCLGRLPVLQLDSGKVVFSSNESARLLLPPVDKNEVAVDQWLEWETAYLEPLLANCLSCTNKPDPALRSQLVNLLIELDEALIGKQFLIESSVSVADIVIWCALFPVVTESRLRQDWLADRSNIVSWFLNLQSQPHVKSAVERICPKSGIAAHQSLTACRWFPSVPVQPVDKQRVQLQSTSSLDVVVKDAPVSDVELEAVADAWKNGVSRRPKPKPQVRPVLPVAGERNIFVTSALPYVNNVPHLGNIIGCVLSADVFARYCRLCNLNTLYICGTDEYGTATETKALEEGLTPQQICDKYFKIHDATYKWFNIGFDHFGRTTTPQQTEICQEIFLQLYENGFTTTQSMEQLLCQKCNRYLADRFVEGICPRCGYEDARGDQCDGCGHLINSVELISPRCKVCQQTPVKRNSEQFFLDLPKIEPLIRHWIDKVWGGWSNNARVIARTWLKDGLKPRCITRDLKWGIPVPLKGYSDKVFYVWFDAPIGYLSISMNYTSEWKQWWQPPKETTVTLYQFMAKDNVPFHSIMFPASLLGANKGYTVVSYIMATEYLNYEDGKFSKSRGVGVFGTDAQGTGIPADVWRFYLLYVRPESQDSSFSWVDLATKNNSELLNNLGNFINRALVFAEKFFGRQVPPMSPNTTDLTFLALVTRELKAYCAALERARLRDGIRHILSISRHGNQYMQSQQPWVLVKGSDYERSQAGTVVGLCCNIACLLAILLQPYMPSTSSIIFEQLQAPAEVKVITGEVTQLLTAGHKIGKPSPLFEKIDNARVEELKQQFSGRQKSSSPDPKPLKKTVTKSPPSKPANGDAVAHLEANIKKQGELLCNLKTSGADKSEWQPYEDALRELQRQLLAAQEVNNKTFPGPADPAEIAQLEAAVAKQGDLVRQMKGSGADKSVWQPEVAKLLELKKQLAAAQGINHVQPPAKGKSKSKK
ncbi:methionine--tRNA ligase, cytoplasmic [Anabrus simplex]|uniref:methionine--tRNA ligase, cytoplasmic n=1 Tax=Anabrus simplex TaxID=316456 RepID=UPI0035A3665C